MAKGYAGQSCSEAIEDLIRHAGHPMAYSEIHRGIRSKGDWKEITIWRITMSNIVNLIPARYEWPTPIHSYSCGLMANMNHMTGANTRPWQSDCPHSWPPCWVKHQGASHITIRMGAMNMATHGQMTAITARRLSQDWNERGYDVLYDHSRASEYVGKIVSWSGNVYNREAELGQLDIAIVEKSSDKAIALIEIEETNDKPKTLLGEIFGFLFGDQVTFREGRRLLVGQWTIFVVLGKSKIPHVKRLQHIRDKVERIRPELSTANSRIGKTAIESFADQAELSALLASILDRWLSNGLS